MGLFARGYENVREEQQRQDANKELRGKQLWRFYLSKDGEEADIRFLTEEPITFYEHAVKTFQGGKERYENHICTQVDCPYCDNGDRPSFKGAYLVIDKRSFSYTNKDGKEVKGNQQVRLFVQGTRVLSQLDRLSARYGLTSRDYIMTRSGKGTSTAYMFDRSDDVSKMTEAEIKNVLPEKIRDDFDGTQDSLYRIVQNQLEMSISKESVSQQDDTDDDDDNDTLVGVPDDEPPFDVPTKGRETPTAKKKTLFKKS
jgi:hypothetical protein